MEALEKNQIDIDRYLMGEMPQDEAEQFVLRMETDGELADQLADTRLAIDIIDTAEDGLLKDRLAALEQEEFGESSSQSPNLRVLVNTEKAETKKEAKVIQMNPLRRYFSIAASVLLFLAAAWFLLRPSSLSNQDLFAENFAPYTNSEVLDRGSADDRQTAYFAYQSGDYDQAYELLSNLPQEAGNQFFTAQAALATDRAEEALDLLTALAADINFPLQEESEWHLALAHLQLDEREAAQAILREISRDNTHSRQRDATVLLTKF